MKKRRLMIAGIFIGALTLLGIPVAHAYANIAGNEFSDAAFLYEAIYIKKGNYILYYSA